MSRKVLLLIAAAMAIAAMLLAASGGARVTIAGLRVSARSPAASSALAVAALAAWLVSARRAGRVTRDLDELWILVEERTGLIMLGLALTAGAIAMRFGTFAASGADASGYLSEAALWATGRLSLQDALSSIAGWPSNPSITAPLGWRPATVAGFLVPTYGPGLPLVLAVPIRAGGTLAACLAIGVCSALAVRAAGAIANRAAGGAAGILAALLLATCPVFLFQSIQPMSDVPVTAAWLLCWWLVGAAESSAMPSSLAGLAGIAAAVAVLIRPNLAPLAAVPFAALAFAPRHGCTLAPSHRRTSAPSHPRTLACLLFAVPVVAAGVFLAWLQWYWYGSPLRSGYGTTEELFALANVGPNTFRYLGWLAATSPALLLAPAGMLAARGSRLTWWMAAFAALVAASYLVYGVFDDWSYLRFLLPALGVGAVFTAALAARALAPLPTALRLSAWCALVLGITALGVSQARTRDVFRLSGQQQRIVQLGGYLRAALPESAVMMAGEQSGAVAYYTGHQIVRWEATSGDELARVVDALAVQRRPLWVVLDAWEEAPFRARFAGVAAATLEWPPLADAGDLHRTRVWRLSDRERFQRGEPVVTDRLR